MRLRAILLAGGAICAGLVLPAQAATPDPVEVARAGDVQLLAGDEEKELCIGLSFEEFDTACAEAGESVAQATADADGARWVGAAVPAATASIEVRRAGVLLGGGPTVAGEKYKGVRAGTVRFALVRIAKTAKPDGLRIRALSAAGALVTVVAADDDEELVIGRTRLKSGRARNIRWSLFAEDTSELTPSVLDLAHETVSRCVGLELNGVDWGGACSSGPPLQSFVERTTALSAETCNPPFRVVYGAVDGSVPSVIVLLGDGRRRTVATVPVGDGRRSYAIATAANAVRTVTVPGKGVVRPGFAPTSAVCAGGGNGLSLLNFGSSAFGLFSLLLSLPPVTPVGPVTAIPGSPGMQVADGPADALCIAVAGKPFGEIGCGIVPPQISEQLVAFDSLTDPHAFALAVKAQVATVRVSTADGKVVRNIPTDPGTGYRGRYAGVVRFASASFANLAELARLELLDAAGKVLYSEASTEEETEIEAPRVGRARRIAGREGGPSLWQTNARYGKRVDRCLSLTAGPAPGPLEDCQASRADATVLLDASCVTKRLSAGIAVREGTRVLADTGRKARRPVRLRRGLAVLTLPATRPLRALTFIRRGRSRRVEIGAPPAGRQCGWHLAPSVEEL